MAQGNNVFESFPLDAPLRTSDAGMQKMSSETHLSVLDDLHDAHKNLVPSFAHAMPGMRESFENAQKHLPEIGFGASDAASLMALSNAGQRGGDNRDVINKFLNGGHTEEVASKVDKSFEDFVSGASTVAANNLDKSKFRQFGQA